MAIQDFLYLDTLPFTESFFIDGVKSSPSVEIDFREQLNLSFNINSVDISVSERLEDLNNYLNKSSINQSQSITLYDLTILLESYLYLLINISSISQLDLSDLTPHHLKRKKSVPDYLLLPSQSYLTELVFSGEKTWGGKYSSLSYSLHLLNNRDTYLHPSQIAHFSYNFWLSNISTSFPSLSPYITDILSFISDDSIASDNYIFNSHKQILLEDTQLGYLCYQLDFLELWLPILLNWYTSLTPEDKLIEKNKESNLFFLLEDISKTCLSKIFDESSFSELLFGFTHQQLSYDYYDLLTEINLIKSRYSINILNPVTPLEKLAAPLINNKSFNLPFPNSSFSPKSISYNYLQNFAAPGGYNLWLLIISSILINRAYILSYNNSSIRNKIPINNTQIGVGNTDTIGRIFKLIYLSGFILKKSNIDALNNLGSNLTKLTKYPSYTMSRITNILL